MWQTCAICYDEGVRSWKDERARLWADLGGIFEVTGTGAGLGLEEMWNEGDGGWATEDGKFAVGMGMEKGKDKDKEKERWEEERSWEG